MKLDAMIALPLLPFPVSDADSALFQFGLQFK